LPEAEKVKAPVVSTSGPVVRERSMTGRSNSVISTSIGVPDRPVSAWKRVPAPMGSGVSIRIEVMAGLKDGSFRESAATSTTS
jgi:hypothetical protein